MVERKRQWLAVLLQITLPRYFTLFLGLLLHLKGFIDVASLLAFAHIGFGGCLLNVEFVLHILCECGTVLDGLAARCLHSTGGKRIPCATPVGVGLAEEAFSVHFGKERFSLPMADLGETRNEVLFSSDLNI